MPTQSWVFNKDWFLFFYQLFMSLDTPVLKMRPHLTISVEYIFYWLPKSASAILVYLSFVEIYYLYSRKAAAAAAAAVESIWLWGGCCCWW